MKYKEIVLASNASVPTRVIPNYSVNTKPQLFVTSTLLNGCYTKIELLSVSKVCENEYEALLLRKKNIICECDSKKYIHQFCVNVVVYM